MEPVEGVVSLPGGLSLSFVETGDRDGPPAVFLHGYVDSWRSFEPVLQYLPAWIHAVALSLRGHGRSAKPADGYSVAALAEDVLGLMDALGIRAAVLVGGSSGGFIARRIAIEHPERARALVFLGSPYALRGRSGPEALADALSAYGESVPTEFIRSFQEGTIVQPVPAPFLERMVGESAQVPARVWRATLAALLNDESDGGLGEIRVPTLAIWGGRDSMVSRADQDALLDAIPQSQLVVYEDAGHSLYWEEPRRVARDITTFIAGLR